MLGPSLIKDLSAVVTASNTSQRRTELFAIEQRGKRWQADIGDSLRYRGKPDLIGRWHLPSKGVGHIIIAAAIAKEHPSHEAASDEAPCHPPPRLRSGDKKSY